MKSRAFSLMELLVVIAIIAVLATVLFPVFGRAKQKAKEANSISNLRQCSLALLLYADLYGGEQYMPQYSEAIKVLSKAPTCDLNDYWRQSCTENVYAPLIGSYGYVRGSIVGDTEAHWTEYLADQTVGQSLLICPFYGSEHLTKFRGDIEPPTCGPPIAGCRYPDRLLVARMDGSATGSNNKAGGSVAAGGFSFSWSSAFVGRY